MSPAAEKPRCGRLLIVDDDAEALFLCGRYLEEAGHEVRTAGSGEEGLALAQEFKPQVILVDAMMPGMDGFAVVQKLRSKPEYDATSIIMLTALVELKDKIAGFRAGINDYLTKPFAPEELLARINGFLASSERQQLVLERSKFEILRQTATAVAHHINNPLQTILTATDMLQDDNHRANWKQIVEMIREKAITIGRLISKLTRTNRIVSTAYVGSERMLDIEASANDLESKQ